MRIITKTEENITRNTITASVTPRHQANRVIIIFAVLRRPQNSPMRWLLLLCPFSMQRNWCLETSKYSLKQTHSQCPVSQGLTSFSWVIAKSLRLVSLSRRFLLFLGHTAALCLSNPPTLLWQLFSESALRHPHLRYALSYLGVKSQGIGPSSSVLNL